MINNRRTVCAAVEMVTLFDECVVPWVDLKTQKLPAMDIDITGSGFPKFCRRRTGLDDIEVVDHHHHIIKVRVASVALIFKPEGVATQQADMVCSVVSIEAGCCNVEVVEVRSDIAQSAVSD